MLHCLQKMMKKKKQQVLLLEEFKLDSKTWDQGSEKTRTLLRLFSCLDLDASFFAEEEAQAGSLFGGIEVRIQRFGFRV